MPRQDEDEPVPAGFAARLREHWLAVSGSVVVVGGFAWLLHAGALPVVPPREAWAGVEPWTVVAYGISFVVVHVLRCARWGLLVAAPQRPPLRLTVGIGLLGYGALVLLPFRLGEAARPALMHSRARLPLGTSAGVVAAERIVDGMVLSSLLLAALLGADLVSPLPDRIGELPIPASVIPVVAWGGVILFGSLSLVMVAVFVWQEPLRRAIESTLRPVSPRLAAGAARAASSVVTGFRFLRDADMAPAFGLLTALYWVLNVAGIWLLLWGTGVEAPTLVESTVILGVLGLGLVVPNAPGYFGTFQISAYSAMVLFYSLGVVTTAGAAFVFLLYVLQMSLTLLAAGVALWLGLRH